MKPDITNKEDIQYVVQLFYESIKTDELLKIFFMQTVAINWEKHLPLMCAFWENIILYTGNYEGNPLATHRRIHMQYGTTLQHFDRWILLWDKTVAKHFAGPNATKMKQHSKAIAAIMMQKI